MKRASAISLFLYPSAISFRISRSRGVRVSHDVFFLRAFFPSRYPSITFPEISGLRYRFPSRTFFVAVVSSSRSASLRTYPSAPASSADRTYSSPLWTVKTTIFISVLRFFISLIASIPVIFGMDRSIRIRSGTSVSANRIDSRPSSASPTILKSGSDDRSALNPCLSIVWSSTIMIL